MAGKKTKEEMDFLEGDDSVYDPKNRLEDSKLFSGTCVMGGCTFSILIKKGVEIKKETYNLLRKFQHNTFIPHLNFYPESNQGRLVIPPVGPLFQSWIRSQGQGQLVRANGAMEPLFKTMVIDLCDVVDKLYEEKIVISNLSGSNLYMASEVAPRILLLVSEAEKRTRALSKGELWKPVQQIVRWCYEECRVQPNSHAERYISYIGNNKFTLKGLKNYPENWDDFTKGEYMLSVIAANQNEIRAAVRGVGVLWPTNMPVELKNILEYEQKQNRNHSKSSQFDYIMLIRNLYKHFNKLPSNIKLSLGSTQEGFLKTLERWTPTIWEDLYMVIGWR